MQEQYGQSTARRSGHCCSTSEHLCASAGGQFPTFVALVPFVSWRGTSRTASFTAARFTRSWCSHVTRTMQTRLSSQAQLWAQQRTVLA